MGRKLGSKNKKVKPTKTTNRNTNINNVHVHVEKQKTRKRRTTKQREPINNPLSDVMGVTRPASQNLGFHPRGLINNEPQQPTIIQIQPTEQVLELEKKLKKYKDKLKSHKDAQDQANQNLLTQLTTTTAPTPNITVTQPPINVNVTNPFTPPVKTEAIAKTEKPKTSKKSVVRFLKSKTKSGKLFKPSELDETGSIAGSVVSTHSSITGTPGTYEEPIETPQMQTRTAKTAAERLASQHARQSKEEKRLQNRLYSLKGSGSKEGSIKYTEKRLASLKDDLENETKPGKRGQIQSKIAKLTTALDSMKEELPDIEIKLTQIRAQREPVKRGRPAGIFGAVSSLFSPAKV